MTIAFVQEADNVATGTSISINFTGLSPASGHVLVAFVEYTDPGSIAPLTAAAGWTRASLTFDFDGDNFLTAATFYKVCGAGESTTQTIANCANSVTLSALAAEYSGFSTATPLEVAGGNWDPDFATKESPILTPTAGIEILVVGAAQTWNGGNNWSNEQINGVTTGVTERGDNHYGCLFDKIIAASSGTYQAVATGSGLGPPGGGSAHLIILRSIGTGGGGGGGGGGGIGAGPNVCTLTSATDSIDFYDYTVAALADDGHDLGVPGAVGRAIKMIVRLINNAGTSTLPQLEAKISTLRRMLAEANRRTDLGIQRQVRLTVQPFGLDVPTTYYVVGGSVQPVAPWRNEYLTEHMYDTLQLNLIVEPWGFGANQSLINSGSLYGRANVDVRFMATGASGTGVDGTPQGENTAALSKGALNQTNKLTTSPSVQAMANQVAWYFGASLAPFGQLYLGIETAKTGTYAGVWEIWTGAAWAGIATTSDFRSGAEGTEFDRANAGTRTGVVTLTGSTAAWVSKAITVNGVALTCYWLRYRLTSFTAGGTAPVLMNGPVRSAYGLAQVVGVPGDSEAAALVHFTNPGSNALAGIKAAIATGEVTTVPPPFVVGLQGSDLYIPSGDTTVALTTDANANNNQRVDLGLVQAINERAQSLDGATEYITVTPTSSDKLATLFAGTGTVEILFKPDTVPAGPICLVSQWSSNSATQCFWFGIDNGQLYMMICMADGSKHHCTGTSTINPGEWVLAAFVFDTSVNEIQIKRDGKQEKRNQHMTSIRTGQTVPFRVGFSSGFTAGDTNSGLAENHFDGLISNVRMFTKTPSVEAGGSYNWPELGHAIENDSADMRALLKMEEHVANTTIGDSAVTFAAAKNWARSSANTTDRSFIGYFQPGAGQTAKALGINLPRMWGEEYRGRVRFLLRASPAATLVSVDDVRFQLQLNVGDASLPMGPPAKFPNVAVPSGGYYLLDLGVFSLPPVALRDAGALGLLTSAKNVLQVHLFVQHNFTSATILRLDALYLLPVTTWYGEYTTFRDTYNSAYDIDQNTGVLFDNLGPEYVVAQTTTVGYTDQARNPYANPGGASRCILRPNKTAWLFGFGLRGVTAGVAPDYVHHVLSDSLTPKVQCTGEYEVLATA